VHARSPKRFFTAAEYLAMERVADRKHEFYQGEMYAMAGGSPAHDQIAGRLITKLNVALEGRRCAVFTSDQRVRVGDSGLYTYPDVSVACGARFDEQGDTLLNPALVVEVLSEATEAYDRGKKFELYRTLPSLGDYVLASQTEPKLEHFARQPDGSWRLLVLGPGDRLHAGSLDCELAVDDVYRGVFDAGAS